MGSIGRLLRFALGAAVVLAAVTFAALEGGDVAVLRTQDAGGSWRETRVWWADAEAGALWIEAATPDRPWLLDMRRHPEVVLDRGAESRHWRATPVESDEARAAVRALLRDKYGWADAWVGLFQDTSQSVAVRLDPR